MYYGEKNSYDGGGESTNTYLAPSSKIFKNSFFKPIVASSLALLLGSALYGQSANTGCVDLNNCTPITGNITFKFGTNSGSGVDYDSGNNTVTFGTDITEVTLKDTNFQGDGFNFPGSTMKVDFNSQGSKTFSLVAEKADFKGNLSITGNGSSNNFKASFAENVTGNITIGALNNASAATTTFTFGNATVGANRDAETTQKLSGDITIYGKNDSGTPKNSFTFNNAIQTQKIWTITGTGEFTFEKNATIQTNKSGSNAAPETIYTGYYAEGTGAATATYTFKGTKNTIQNTGEGIVIQAAANKTGTEVKNTIIFQGSSSTNEIKGIVLASANNNSATYNRQAMNDITFDASTSNNTITGTIKTGTGPQTSNVIKFNNTSGTNTITGTILSGPGKNTITFGSNGDRQAKTSATNIITGSITANGGTNTITFNGDATNSIGSKDTASNLISATGGTNTITFNGTGTNSITNGISANGGNNNITFSAGTNTITGNITADGSTNNISMDGINTINGTITAGKGGNSGTNNLYFSGTSTKIGSSEGLEAKATSTSIIAEQTSGNRTNKTNLLLFTSTSNNLNLETIKAENSRPVNGSGNPLSKNALSFNQDSGNTLAIQTITAGVNGFNYIGKNIITNTKKLTEASTLSFTDGTGSMKFTDDTNAFVGTLSIGSMTSSGGGVNNISYQASATILPTEEEKKLKGTQTQSAIIGALPAVSRDEGASGITLGTAISGNNNLYLDLSKNTDFAEAKNASDSLLNLQSVIIGNINNATNGTNNIKIVGGAGSVEAGVSGRSGTAGVKIGLVGNITTNGGTNNLIFENSIWLPSYLTNANKALGSLPRNLSGTLTNSNNGTTNIVLRTSSATLNSLGTSMFNVNNQSGSVNIVVQGQVNVGANISYGSGTTTFIFANSNDMNAQAKTGSSDNFSNGNTDVSNTKSKVLGVTYQDGLKLSLKDKNIDNGTFLGTYSHYFSNVAEGDGILTLKTKRENSSGTQTDTITIKGLALGDISELAPSATNVSTRTTTYNYNVTIDSKSAFVGKISLQDNSNVTLIMKEGSKLLTDSKHLKIASLTISDTKGVNTNEILLNTFAQSNTIIDIATINPDGSLAANTNGSLNPSTRTDFRLLTIGASEEGKDKTSGANGLQGTGAIFRVYMNAGADQDKATLGDIKAQTSTSGNAVASQDGTTGQYGHVYSDRILILSGTSTGSGSDTTKVNYIQALADSSTQLENIKYNGGGTETAGNIAVATVKGTNGSQVATFEGAAQIQGFDVVGTTLTAVATDQYGKVQSQQNLLTDANSYTTYFIGSMTSQGASLANQQVSASALGANYDLYLANLNSLNKRMGELRENANSQGAWVRVFNGMQTSKFALETKSIYTTIQAGYDYAFGFNGANNYLGFAISYANSISDSKTMSDIDASNKGIKNINSNAVEFAIYNAYVQDGASKESGWKNGLYTDSILKFSYITSKLDLTGETKTYSTNNYAITFSQEVGYRFLLGKAKEFYIDPQAEISLGYLNQSDLKQELGQSFLNGIQDSIFTLRGRIGSNFGYDFKNFTQDKGFNAKIYLGTYFVGDYISGGDVSLTSNLGSKVSLSPLASTTRFVLNLGTNFKIKDAHRIYFDFERSFGGKIITDYQINLGYRYSFGASNYTPYNLSNTQEIKDTNSIKEIEPTKGYYLELLNKQDLSKKESKLLKDLKDLKVKTNNNTKTYLIGPFENEDAALKQKQALQGLLKELNSEGNVIVIE